MNLIKNFIAGSPDPSLPTLSLTSATWRPDSLPQKFSICTKFNGGFTSPRCISSSTMCPEPSAPVTLPLLCLFGEYNRRAVCAQLTQTRYHNYSRTPGMRRPLQHQASFALAVYFSGILPHNIVSKSQLLTLAPDCEHQPTSTIADEQPTPKPTHHAPDYSPTSSQPQQGISSLASSLTSSLLNAHAPASLMRRASVSSCSSVTIGIPPLSTTVVPQLLAVASRVGGAVTRVRHHACTLAKGVIRRSTRRMFNVATTHDFVASPEVLAAGRVEATITFRRLVRSNSLRTTKHSVKISFPRTATGYDILRELRSREGIDAVSLDYSLPETGAFSKFRLAYPIFKYVPLSASTVILDTVSIDSEVAGGLRVRSIKSGVDITKITNYEACIIGTGHPRLGVREHGSSDMYILFDLQLNGTNVYTSVHSFSVPPTKYFHVERTLESEVLTRTSVLEIAESAKKVIKAVGEYRYLENNCQKFVSSLADELGIPGLARRKWLPSRPFWDDTS